MEKTVAGVSLGSDEFAAGIRADLARVEQVIADGIAEADGCVIEEALHLFQAGGKRFRPMFTVLSGRIGGAPSDQVITAAAAMELTHLATLYHDDVMDEADTRRGAPSANARWGNSIAILAGDFLVARASAYGADLGPRAVGVIAKCFGELVTGQMLELKGASDGDPVQHYLDTISEQAALARKLDAVVREHAALPRWKPAVDALSHVKGIDVPSAFLLAVEFGDFSRFDGGRAVSCWAGLVPSSSDSADKHANGHITKSGNPYVRGALIEGLSNMHVRKSEAKKLRKGQEVSGPVRRLCRQCDMRMAERHERMSKEGKQANVIKVALANEMVRWVWAIGLAVERERAS